MSDMPEKIYLLHEAGDSGEHLWCEHDDPSGDGAPSTEYIRADLVPAPVEDTMPAPVNYTDGTMSREYEEHPDKAVSAGDLPNELCLMEWGGRHPEGFGLVCDPSVRGPQPKALAKYTNTPASNGVDEKMAKRAFQAGFEISGNDCNAEQPPEDLAGYLERGYSVFARAYSSLKAPVVDATPHSPKADLKDCSCERCVAHHPEQCLNVSSPDADNKAALDALKVLEEDYRPDSDDIEFQQKIETICASLQGAAMSQKVDVEKAAARYEEYRAKYTGGIIKHANNSEAFKAAMEYALPPQPKGGDE